MCPVLRVGPPGGINPPRRRCRVCCCAGGTPREGKAGEEPSPDPSPASTLTLGFWPLGLWETSKAPILGWLVGQPRWGEFCELQIKNINLKNVLSPVDNKWEFQVKQSGGGN